jgi:uncharacterized protein (TIGR03435 family)
MTRTITTTIFVLSVIWRIYGQGADPPPSFEVASVKLSPPLDRANAPIFGCSGGPGTADPGLYACRYATLQGLIIEAFGLMSFQLPYSASGDHSTYDIAAKVPPGATREQFKLMMQTLLAERFKLGFHYEKREAQVYELAIARTGLKMRASPSEPVAEPKAMGGDQPKSAASPVRDEYGFPAPPATYRGTTMSFMRGIAHWVARGASMDQVAGILSRTLRTPVTDLTGLKGKYDFTLNFSSSSVGRPEGTLPSTAASPLGPGAALSDDSLPTIFAVLQAELGLKLEQKKGSIEFFVIDHAEKRPVEN